MNSYEYRRMAMRQRVLAAAVSACAISAFVPIVSAQLVPNADNVLTQSATTGTITIHTLTLQAAQAEVDLTIDAAAILTFNGQNISKTGAFNSTISGGIIKSSTDLLTINVNGDGGALTMASAISDTVNPTAVTKTGVGTLILSNADQANNNFSGGLIISQGTVQVSSDVNLGGPGGVIFNGGALQVLGTVEFNVERQFTINQGVAANLSVPTQSSAVFNGINQFLAGGSTGGSFVKSGGGLLSIGNSNSFAGPVTVSAGILELTDPGALGGSNQQNLRSQITLTAFNSGQGSSQLSLHPTSFDAAKNASFGNSIVVSGQSGTESTTIDLTAPAGSPTGNVQLAGLQLSNANLNFTGNNSVQFTGPVALTGKASLSNASDVNFSGQIGGSAQMTKTGGGTLSFTGNAPNGWAGPITINGGVVSLAKASGVNSIPGDAIITSGTLRLDSSNQIADISAVTVNGGAFSVNNQTDSISELTNNGGTFSTGSGTLFVTSASTTAFNSGTNTVNSGGTLNTVHLTVSGGVNTVQSNGTIIVGAAGLDFLGLASPAVTFNADLATPGKLVLSGNVSTSATGTASLFNSGPVPIAGTIDLNAAARTFTINHGTNTIDMSIGGRIINGSLVKDGNGLLQLNAASTYAGGTTLVAGTLQATDPGALGTGAVTFSGGTLDFRSDAASVTFANGLTAAPTASTSVVIDRLTAGTAGTFSIPSINLGVALNVSGSSGGSLKVTGPVTLQNNATLNNSVGTEFSGVVSGAFGLTKTLGGTWTLSGSSSNTYSGTTAVNAGALLLAKSGGATAVAGNLTINPFGTVTLNGSEQIADSSALVFNATGGAATLNLNNQAETVGSMTDNATGGTVQLGAAGTGAFAFGGSNDTKSFSGTISGNGSITKWGSGVYTLTGPNTFTGGASVRAGTLTFSQTPPGLNATVLASGAWSVYGGATLNFPGGSSVVTNQANVLLTGASPVFSAINALATNSATGIFSLSNGATFTTASSLTNDGTLSLTGPSTALTVTTSLANTGTPGSSGTTIVGSGSSLTANFIRQNTLTSTGTTTLRQQSLGGGTSVLSSLSLGGTSSAPLGTLNLADTKMVINDATAGHAATFTAINAMINAAAHYNAGTGKDAWDTPGIGSSLLSALDNFHNIGTADNATLGVLTKSTFGGQSVSSSSILLAYTLSGDTNLDGKVDFSDFLNFQNHYTHPGTWQDGDFDHNGIVNFSDFLLFQNGYGHSLPGAGPTFITAAENAQVAAFAASVPEPTGMMLLAVGATGLLRRRKWG